MYRNGAIRNFYLTEILQSKQNSLKNFRLFKVIFETFFNRSLKKIPEGPTELCIQSLLNVCHRSESKTI